MKITGWKQYCFWIVASAAVILPGLWSTSATAQSVTGSIYGDVTDSTGAVIPAANVTATNVQTNEVRTVPSNKAGAYVFPSMAPGDYAIITEAAGFSGETQTGIHVDANENVRVAFSLKIGGTSASVTVEASATLVDTRESQIGSTVDQKRLEELPLLTRDAYDLVSLSPGVSNVNEGNGSNGGQIGDNIGATFSTNGLRVYENSFYLDGANNTSFFRPGGNLPPNPDALLEFRVLTSNFDAEFGTMPGAVVNMITRSGTNKYHGLLYDFVRNNIFNGRNWFTLPNTPAQHLRQNTFGGTIGGPVLHNKLFGFFSYDGLRVAQFQTINQGTAQVPTAAERTGDFTADAAASKPVCGPNTYPCGGTPGLIPAAYQDPVALAVLKSIPLPVSNNATTGGPAPQQSLGSPVVSDQLLGRGDYQLNSSHRLSYMYFHEWGSQASPNSGGQTVLGFAGDSIQNHQTTEVGTDTWTISPTKLNTLLVFYGGNHYQAGDLYSGQRTLNALGATIPDAGSPSTQPNFRVAGGFTIGNSGSAPNIYTFTSLGLADTFHWSYGNHSLKMGASFSRNKFYLNTVGQRASIYTVNATAFGTNNVFANFLMGKSMTFTQNNGFLYNLHYSSPALFVQDDWRVTPRLTLNLGLRWETFPPFHGDNNMGSFTPNVQSRLYPSAPVGIQFAGDPGVPDGVLNTTYYRFAPRIGFAADPFGNGKTAIRAGWGFFYSQVPGTFYSNIVSPLYAVNVAISNATSFVNPYAGSTTPVDPFPFTPNLKNPTFAAGLAFPAEPPNNKVVPYVMEYNLTLEQQLGRNWAVSASYVGNGTRKSYTEVDENAPIYSSTCTTATCGSAPLQLARRPYKPGGSYVFNAIYEYLPEVSSSYNSLQASITRRFAHNFSINANYVWAKDMGVGNDPTPNGFTVPGNSNSYDLHADYGKTGYDQPQRFVMSYVWASPDVHFWGYAGRALISGWRLNGITTVSTGQPYNILSGTDANFDGQANDRPNMVGNPKLPGGRSRVQQIAQYFNTAAFAQVPAGTPTGLGTTQYNLLVGPPRVNTDLAAVKAIPVWRENQVQFRAEGFNIFNETNLGNPTAQLTSANNGKITSAAAARILQLALKYSF